MITPDHIGFAVADYQRSKGFYEKSLAPLGLKLLMEFSGAAAGFGRTDGEGGVFFIEAGPWGAGAWAASHRAEG